MDDTQTKALLAAALALMGAYFRELALPVLLLLAVMVLDYISGMAKAYMTHQLSSRVGLRGIVKKLCYMMGVSVAVITDLIMQYAGKEAGVDISGRFFCALLVVVWLIFNESISILENLTAMDVPVPSFLMKLVRRLKQTAEQKGEQDGGSG